MVTSTLFPSQVELLAMWVNATLNVTENIEREREERGEKQKARSEGALRERERERETCRYFIVVRLSCRLSLAVQPARRAARTFG